MWCWTTVFTREIRLLFHWSGNNWIYLPRYTPHTTGTSACLTIRYNSFRLRYDSFHWSGDCPARLLSAPLVSVYFLQLSGVTGFFVNPTCLKFTKDAYGLDLFMLRYCIIIILLYNDDKRIFKSGWWNTIDR